MNNMELQETIKNIFSHMNHVTLYNTLVDDDDLVGFIGIDLPDNIEYPDKTILCFLSINFETLYMDILFVDIHIVQPEERNTFYDIINTINVSIHSGSFFISRNNKKERSFLSFKESAYLGKEYKYLDADLVSKAIANLLVSLYLAIKSFKKHQITLGATNEK